jgi:alpha-1,6-mannosyltransferase
MACGLPVVGVAAGGVGESVDHSVGELATHSTGPDFAAAVEALFERDLGYLRRAARQRACDQHGWDAVFRRLSALYADVSGEAAFSRPPTDFALAS